MLNRSFILFPGLSKISERKLWDAGILTWDDFASQSEDSLRTILGSAPRKALRCIEPYRERLIAKDAEFFQSRLPSAERFRALSDFGKKICYLDIETTGSQQKPERITVIGCYDGVRPAVFRLDSNINDCMDWLSQFETIVTYNGSGFDLPMIEKFFQRKLHPHIHIDLRPVFCAVGYKQGLKKLEAAFGLSRGDDLAGADGWEAIKLWRKYSVGGSRKALEKLIRYNMADVAHLEPLLRIAVNLHIRTRQLPFEELVEIPDFSTQTMLDLAVEVAGV